MQIVHINNQILPPSLFNLVLIVHQSPTLKYLNFGHHCTYSVVSALKKCTKLRCEALSKMAPKVSSLEFGVHIVNISAVHIWVQCSAHLSVKCVLEMFATFQYLTAANPTFCVRVDFQNVDYLNFEEKTFSGVKY